MVSYWFSQYIFHIDQWPTTHTLVSSGRSSGRTSSPSFSERRSSRTMVPKQAYNWQMIVILNPISKQTCAQAIWVASTWRQVVHEDDPGNVGRASPVSPQHGAQQTSPRSCLQTSSPTVQHSRCPFLPCHSSRSRGVKAGVGSIFYRTGKTSPV